MTACGDEFIQRTLNLADQMKLLADEGQEKSDDYGCAMLFGIVRDCAYQITQRAETEREMHATMNRG